MQAFHNDPAVKAKYLARIEAHRIADEIVQGIGYQRNGAVRACAVGCTLDAYNHSRYPVELGLPEWLAHLEDAIHEGVPLEYAKRWPGEFLSAIPVGASIGADLHYELSARRLERLLPTQLATREPYALDVVAALRRMLAWLRSPTHDPQEYSAAMGAAESAAENAGYSAMNGYAGYAARSAEYAAGSAVRSVDNTAWDTAWEQEAATLLELLRRSQV